MIKDKIMILAPYRYDINSGGPAGFIAHNLHNKIHENYALSEDFINENLIFKVKRKLLINSSIKNYMKYYFGKVNAHKYKYIYFHDAFTFEYCKDLISNKQVVIFQPHSPERLYQEVQATNSNDLEKVRIAKMAEENAFLRADILVFPNDGCLSIYQELINGNQQIEYILSGAQKKYGKLVDTTKLIDNSKINLMFIGRRNKIKGFDILINTFNEISQYRDDLNLILIGSGEKVVHKNIIDIGFSDNPIGWYNSVDYLVNVNRQSYFDLSIIEALSTGVPIIMSHNNGHNYYKDKSSLIRTYDINEDGKLFEILMSLNNKRDYSNKQNPNMFLYENKLSDLHCHRRFENFFQKLA